MNSTLSLKLRTPKGLISLENLALISMLSELKKEISMYTDIPVSSLVVKAGFPPINIAQYPDTSSIKSFNITSGDLLIIEENSNLIKPSLDRIKPFDISLIADHQIPNKEGLIMIRRMIPTDNSCLFNAISYNMSPKAEFNSEEARQIVASYIISDPKEYDGLLEKPPEVYADWITRNTSWGGVIEMTILAKYHDVEICAINIQNCQSFFYGKGLKRMFLLYDGVHYDAVGRNICKEINEDEQTLFEKNDLEALEGVLVVVKELRKKQEFRELVNFEIPCNVCYEELKGEKEAMEHFKKTGHLNLKEIDKKNN